MDDTKPRSDFGYPNNLPDALVAFYLTEETGLPFYTEDYERVLFTASDSDGNLVKKSALRVTFDRGTSIKQQCHLLSFGSDPQRCNVILNATEASSVHCRIYAQLNSGLNVSVIEDTSTSGTKYVDRESRITGVPKQVVGRRVAAYALCRIIIGRNIFSLWPPIDEQELSWRERWFQGLDPILITEHMLQEQLLGVIPDFRPLDVVGRGGMGEVSRYMEMTTGLMIAVKEEEVNEEGVDERIQKEIAYMRNLKHPNLVEYIMSNSAIKVGVKTWFTAMPLYQGRLCDILPLEISAIEEVMLQLLEGVQYMHVQGVLHKDIKPENILIKAKSRPDVVLADYGICASLNNQAELMGPSGTRGYAAPEISRKIVQTPAVDVFALGATLFVMLEPKRCPSPYTTIATLENVMRHPPRVYTGLVQSMMDPDPTQRPSLKECFDIIKAKKRGWKKPIPLALLPSALPPIPGPRRSQRIQKATGNEPPIPGPRRSQRIQKAAGEAPILDLSKFTARKPRIAPFVARKYQQGPARLELWDQIGEVPGLRALNQPPEQKREPQVPTPLQQVDFSGPPPAASANFFAQPCQEPASNIMTRKAAPPMQKEMPAPIKKPDNDIKRRIRRGDERRKMIERWHSIRVQKNKVCHGAGELVVGKPLNVLRGLRDMAQGGFGLPGKYLGLIFNDLAVASPALYHIAPQTKRWGLNSNKRLMYGLKSQSLWPMTPDEYAAERLQSELNFPNNSTERNMAQARSAAAANHWQCERERAQGAEREMWEEDQARMRGISRRVSHVRF